MKNHNSALLGTDSTFRKMFERHSAVMLLIDPISGNIVAANESAAKFYGYSRDGMKGMPIQKISVAGDEKIAKSGELDSAEEQNRAITHHRCSDGGIHAVEVFASPIEIDQHPFLFSIIHDVTERRRALEKLRNERLLLRTVIDNIPDSIYTKDLASRKTLANLTDILLSKVKSEEELLGKTDFDFYPKELAEGFFANDQLVMKTGQPILNREEYLFDAKGQKQWLLTSKLPLRDEKGDIVGMVGIGRNITDRKQAEAEVKIKNEQLIISNAEKDKFFSIIAHDLRSPMIGLLGLTEILATESDQMSSEEINKFGNELHNSVLNIYTLLENLLEWAQLQRGAIVFTPKDLSLSAVFSQSVASIKQRAMQKGVNVTGEIPETLRIFADEKMIQTILRNLLSNAVKFTRRGGKIVAKARETENGMVEISVTDSGVGIAKDRIGKLFTLGEKVNSPGTEGEPSSGLGLLLCKEFVEKHGGKIWAESEVENKKISKPGWSTFYFSLGTPLLDERSQQY